MPGKLLSYFTLALLLFGSISTGNSAPNDPQGFTPVPGPDIITGNVGEIGDLEQYGEAGTQVGLGISTTSCNAGNVTVQFIALPDTRHPVIMHNLYRMSGGSGNDDRFEQVGQSWVKHAFGADQFETCFPCTPANFTHLGVGCSDTYANFQSAEQTDLGSRAWINPFTGVFQTTDNNHNGHVHTGTSHRLLVEKNDLNTTLNPGASYYAEVQYISSDEYTWCQTHPGQCNMYNNASYLQYTANGTTSFSFIPVGGVVRMMGAVHAWTGATINTIEPDPGNDGRAFVAYKVTNPSPGLWHYEYAVYNENLDRAIQSFSVPLGCAITLTNVGFHAPPNPPGFPNDGTQGGLGFSNAAWASDQTTGAISWNSETFAQNQNANAIRWGTLYNFRFDSDKPPVATNATIGYFKTGTPTTVAILGPNACDVAPSPTPSSTPGVTPGPTPSPTAAPSATPVASPTPAGTPGGSAQALNLSTRLRVQTGDSIGIGGFIITGSAPKHVLVRAIGPSVTGVPGVLADPVLELHRPGGLPTITNDNWRDDPAQETAIIATGIAPTNDLEAAIDVTLNPGAYTAVLRGKNDASGIALIEVYDLSQAVPAKLANISTRAFVGTGDSAVIAGFILGGNSGGDRIVVRGLGPSLAPLGVANALTDPALELRDGNGTAMISNNNWPDNPAQASELTAAGLAPTSAAEAAIAATLPPGLYTAVLTGQGNTTGVGLVEVYDLGASGVTPGPSPTATPPNPTPSIPPPSPTPTPSAATPTPSTASPTPTPGASKTCSENFDGSAGLPPGWSGSWVISTINPFSPPNCLFVPDQASVSDAVFDSPNISINSAAAVLSLQNNFDTEHTSPPGEVFWDGWVMEVSINGGAFSDVTDPSVGGTFVTGGYTGEIDGTSSNPLAGRPAWSGNSGGYIHTVINFPGSLNGQTIKVRFRMGTGASGSAPGVRVDDFVLTGGSCP